MNNKRLGTEWEHEACDILAKRGFWVHFITPDSRGAQPFDIIAVKGKYAYAIECKTLAWNKRYFSIDRLEENQKLSFSRWIACGNGEPIVLIKQNNDIVSVRYIELLLNSKIDMHEHIQNDAKMTIGDKTVYGVLVDILGG